jgi:ribokinase
MITSPGVVSSNEMKGLEAIRVVGLGQACVDYLGRIPHYPHEDQKIELRDMLRQCGGPASTALVTLSRLGIHTAFLGSVSDDPFGQEIVEGLHTEGVDCRCLKVTPGYTSQFAFIAISERGGQRTIFWHRGSVPHLECRDVDLSPFSKAEVLHLDGLMVAASIEAARQAKDLGITVVMDGGTMREGTRELLGFIDVLIASERFAQPLVRPGDPAEKAVKTLRALGPRTVIATMGPRGSIGQAGDGEMTAQKAFPVKAVDTTGAGDVYHGAYIYGMLQGWGMGPCMRFAAACSALKCQAVGAQQGIPKLAQIRTLMESHPEI